MIDHKLFFCNVTLSIYFSVKLLKVHNEFVSVYKINVYVRNAGFALLFVFKTCKFKKEFILHK